jgi:hypothetical protein
MWASTLLLAVQALLPPKEAERIDRLVGAVTFREVPTATPAEAKVYALLTRAEVWRDAFRTVESKVGAFPDTLSVQADFDYDGEELAKAAGRLGRGKIRFNLRRLGELQAKIDETEAKRKELEKQGRKLIFRIPPARIERVIHHELVHVLQQNYPAPMFFNEGLATHVADDPNCLHAFAFGGKEVRILEEGEYPEGTDAYARGHLFWKWLAKQGWDAKVMKSTVIERKGWVEALEEASGLEWRDLKVLESEWSGRELARLRERISK